MKERTLQKNNRTNQYGQGRTHKKGFPFFWVFYLLFVIIMVVFWIWVVKYVKESLVLYEQSQPANTMEKVLEQFRQTGLEQYMTVDGEISRFETAADYTAKFQGDMSGKILFYLLAKGYQDPAAPRYELFADGEHIGFCTLKETSAEPFFLNLLTMSEWALDKVELESVSGEESVEITVPDSYQVSINGIPVDDRELTGEAFVPQEFTYVSEYVEVPSFVTYRAGGMLQKPKIEIRDRSGQTVLEVDGKATDGTESESGISNGTAYEISRDDRLIKVEIKGFPESEMPSELSNMALENTERYTNFFSVDLPGCRGSVSPIKDMFPSNSYYLELADTYRREDMWMYSSHNAPVFRNETVGHYIRYSDDLFSCEVYFDKDMLLHKTGKVKVDTTNFRLYYGLLDGEWKILDIVTLLGNEAAEKE